MIKTQVIKESNKPIAVIMDYKEYVRLKEIKQDKEGYTEAMQIKQKTKKWTTHGDLKKLIGM